MAEKAKDKPFPKIIGRPSTGMVWQRANLREKVAQLRHEEGEGQSYCLSY